MRGIGGYLLNARIRHTPELTLRGQPGGHTRDALSTHAIGG
jgi:hypothetical protein